jgi:hypothetical protein
MERMERSERPEFTQLTSSGHEIGDESPTEDEDTSPVDS